ncbi:DNA polymerase III subunit beta (plasmid) [Aneurinibacillus sp. Ricciae_BoGa-3]|uniref:DNA polymerase III subunit beta n=1 Tax=Aneurinibacillus sp. Ricciae_BoGa-3 TaxID=3022697 RepID=UPI002341E327|nr:DNA polymerase III subunit beta [Aneurinibacillus sp. Ricciae_BoGa-3]WCK57608.1 DNA polymerase III subunit beta [Aneurinibacillus sp. Ricciae_BoGa-3]
MEFKIPKKILAKQIGMNLKAIPTKTEQPILKNLLVEAKADGVTLTSTDGVLSVISNCSASVIQQGSVCVEGKLLDAILKKIKKDIEITLRTENDELVLEIEASKMTIKTANADEYPQLESFASTTSFEIDGVSLIESIKQTSGSTIKNESRPILSGILFKVEGNYLTLVSTDGYRMSLKICKVTEVTGEKEVVVPVDSLVEVGRILASYKNATVHISFSDKGLLFIVDGVRIQTTLLTGEFIQYKKIFGMKAVTKAIIDKNALLNILERATVFIPKSKLALVSLKIEDDVVDVQIATESGNIEETIEANMTGEPLSITFNLSYLLLALTVMAGERVSFGFINNMSPCILEAVGNKAYKHMVLPVRPSI